MFCTKKKGWPLCEMWWTVQDKRKMQKEIQIHKKGFKGGF